MGLGRSIMDTYVLSWTAVDNNSHIQLPHSPTMVCSNLILKVYKQYALQFMDMVFNVVLFDLTVLIIWCVDGLHLQHKAVYLVSVTAVNCGLVKRNVTVNSDGGRLQLYLQASMCLSNGLLKVQTTAVKLCHVTSLNTCSSD